jgi:hypothetical protein
MGPARNNPETILIPGDHLSIMVLYCIIGSIRVSSFLLVFCPFASSRHTPVQTCISGPAGLGFVRAGTGETEDDLGPRLCLPSKLCGPS